MSSGYYNCLDVTLDDVADQVAAEASEGRILDPPTDFHVWESRSEEEKLDREAMARLLRRVAIAIRSLDEFDSGHTADWEEVKTAFLSIIDEHTL
jgi:hypothetical protein